MSYKALAGIDFKSCEKDGKVKYCCNCSDGRQRACEAEVNGTKPLTRPRCKIKGNYPLTFRK